MTTPPVNTVNILRAVKDNIDSDIQAVIAEIESHESALDELYHRLATLNRVKRSERTYVRPERTIEGVLSERES